MGLNVTDLRALIEQNRQDTIARRANNLKDHRTTSSAGHSNATTDRRRIPAWDLRAGDAGSSARHHRP
jgi:hypothetical protein